MVKLTFLVCFWALPDFFYIHDILNQPTVFWGVFFFSSGGANSLPQSFFHLPTTNRKTKKRVRKEGIIVRLQQSDFLKCHSKQYIQ